LLLSDDTQKMVYFLETLSMAKEVGNLKRIAKDQQGFGTYYLYFRQF
jgi:hypothetical protein